MSNIELYTLHGCPYCATVESKLAELGLDYETHSVVGRPGNRSDVYEISGQYQVPVLVDPANGVKGMNESTRIVSYLEREYGDSDSGGGSSGGLLSSLLS